MRGQEMALVRTLINRDPAQLEQALPRGLGELYDGDLQYGRAPAERPFVIANFVSTLDGVVSFETKGRAGGSAISDCDIGDRFIMGLLRASVDAILVGARTFEAVSPESLWTPEDTYPDAKALYAEYRLNVLHKPEYPLLVIVSGTGRLDLDRAIFRTPGVRTVLITTPDGEAVLSKAGARRLPSVRIHALDPGCGAIAPSAILQILHVKLGVKTLLHEGGPTLFGQFLAAEAVDELFLTLSPKIAGRGAVIRPGLVQGMEFHPEATPRFQLLTVKQRSEHLYLRYRRT